MSPLPLPDWLGDPLARRGTNPSLVFERTFDGYAADWKDIPAAGKKTFLSTFTTGYSAAPADYTQLVARRRQALGASGATTFELTTLSRLAIGLGLASPLENGLLLDRRTGAPYLPGSSVKGLARATAALVAAGEIEAPSGSRDYWEASETLLRIFGAPAGSAGGLRRGDASFFDAFPATWPLLEIDVLTTHHQQYYTGDGSPPADWDEPVPVQFLTVAAGTTFVFHVASRNSGDAQHLEIVIGLGLEWLGIGAKKSAGYGVLGQPAPARQQHIEAPTQPRPQAPRGRPRGQERPPAAPPPPRVPGETLWKDVEIRYERGQVVAQYGPKRATGSLGQLEPDIAKELRSGASARLDVVVRKGLGGELSVVRFVSKKG